jgi:hypothetical protein
MLQLQNPQLQRRLFHSLQFRNLKWTFRQIRQACSEDLGTPRGQRIGEPGADGRSHGVFARDFPVLFRNQKGMKMTMSTRSTNSGPDAKSDMRPEAKKGEWAQAADKGREAVESVGAMASHAGSAVGAMASDAVGDVGRKADSLASSAGAGMKEMGDRLSRSGPQSGMLGSATHAVGQSVRDGGEYLESAKLSGMGNDIAQMVRQNPLPAVGIAFGLGWLLASRMRN